MSVLLLGKFGAVLTYIAPIWRILTAAGLVLFSDSTFAATVSVDDWIARLTVFYAAVAIMIAVDGVALFFVLRALRSTASSRA